MENSPDQAPSRAKTKAPEQQPHAPGSQSERAAKRQRGCIKYYMGPARSALAEEGDAPAGTSAASDEASPEQMDAAPARTPAAASLLSRLSHNPAAPSEAIARPVATGIQTLQRKFNGHTLQTPAAAPERSSQEEDLDGFVLHSQPTYERVLSQRVAEPDGAAPGDSQAVADTQFDAALLSQRPGAGAAPSEACSSQPLPSGSNSTGAAPLAPAPGDPPAARQGLTPAVHSVDRVQLNNANANANAPASLFPIFRSRRDCKTVYIVRHGESEYNAATAAAGSGWADPLIYDAPLTAKGQAQARALLHAITQWDLPKDVLWACSPLTRAVETMLLACPDPRVRAGAAVHVLPDISEKVFTSGDVGRPPAVLSQRFPELAPCLASLPETWWYTTEARPNCALQRAFNAHEPRASVERRVKAFRQWVLGRPESVIVAFGHSSYWKAFATAANNGVRVEALPNCGWMKLHI